MSADFLVELGTEELPPKALLTLQDAFAAGIAAGLADARLQHGDILSYATPRRLAVLVRELSKEQPAQVIENRGPPTRMAYDAEGKPTKAAEAFAAKCGVTVSELETLSTDKGGWLYYKGAAAGVPAAAVLPQIVSAALDGLPIPKRMRWGAGASEFVRPVHWLLMLHGADVVPATILGLTAGNLTYGHRFHAPEALVISEPESYSDRLQTEGHVVASFAARRELVLAAAREAATQLVGTALLQAEVVDEVTALVEWPVPVAGHFDSGFLRLPREVLISTLQDHQRYFPVTAGDDLQPAFITISNIASSKPTEVRRGNERVVLPRLADAAFFWDQDRATPLAARVPALDQVVYQHGLGSLRDKSARVAELAALLLAATGADGKAVARAAELSRADLLTAMVGEFPELQGRMGYYYASGDGEPAAVAIALEEQYLPRQAGDRLPATPAGSALALADRLDTLAGIFTLGKKPSGNKDPFGLRRQALGLVRIFVEGGIDADLPTLLLAAARLQPAQPSGGKGETKGKGKDKSSEQGKATAAKPEAVAAAMHEFIIDRLRAWYLDGLAPGLAKGAVNAEVFAAVLAREPASLADFHARICAVAAFMQNDSAASLAAANKRIANILKKQDEAGAATAAVDEALFDAAAETALQKAVTRMLAPHAADMAQRDYGAALERLAGLRAPVDHYFDKVMVMADDPRLRNNRIAQLGQLRKLFLDVADISQISAP